MGKLLVVIVLIAGAWFGYQQWLRADAGSVSAGVEQIENPVYAEIRVEQKIADRNIEMALFGKMTSDADCRDRAKYVWGKVIEGCANCTMTVSICQAALPPRYARLFDNVPINSTYLAFTRGASDERDGRMVIWGVNAAEGNAFCDFARTEFQKRYTGRVECVAARAE